MTGASRWIAAAAGLEVLTGAGLIVAPSSLAFLLFGSEMNASGNAAGRIAGLRHDLSRPDLLAARLRGRRFANARSASRTQLACRTLSRHRGAQRGERGLVALARLRGSRHSRGSPGPVLDKRARGEMTHRRDAESFRRKPTSAPGARDPLIRAEDGSMTEGDAAAGAVRETTVFLSYFGDLPDYRQKGKVAYPLDEVLLLLLAAALAGAETVADIARFGRAKLLFLQRFRRFANGTPSHDQLGIILARLDPVAFQRCFVAWTAALTKTSAEVIAIDGKRVRRSYRKKGADAPIHVVSAFAARQRMVLGRTKVGDKSNEIVAIPALLELLAIEGAVVTLDAMGCQRNIAQTIIDKKADYILGLKGNQGTLRNDVEVFANEQKAVGFANTSVSRDTTVDGDHGRIETRTVTVFHDIGWLQDAHQWPGLKSVVMVESERETNGKV